MVTSITAVLSLRVAACNLVCSDTSDHSLSIFTMGVYYWFLWRWRCLCPFFPKYPGWLKWRVRRNGGNTICSCWFSYDAYHQLDLYHLNAFCVFQLYRVRVIRVLWAFWSFSNKQSKATFIFNRIYHFSIDLINI